ncbi:MAG: GNAT family N-acetyltransferase [Bacteroidia bacterium]
MIQIFPFKYHNNFIASHAHEIRRKVFVLEQHVQQNLEFDEHEPQCHHYLAYLDNRSVGTARWRLTDEGAKLERIAVLPQYRNKGIGTVIVNHLIEDARAHNKTIYVTAQTFMYEFFEKMGFVLQPGEFIEAGLAHYKLILPERQI